MLFAQSVGGRLLVRCADGSACPLKRVEAKPCCRHKPCHQPLLSTCVVVITPSVETTKPQATDASVAPLVDLAPAAPIALLDGALPQRVIAALDSFDPPPPVIPVLSVRGPRPPPSASNA